MTSSEGRRALARAGFSLQKIGGRYVVYERNGIIANMPTIEKSLLSRSAEQEIVQAIKKAEAIDRAEEAARKADSLRPITRGEISIGRGVRAARDFEGVPAGTAGKIQSDYGRGITVQWDLPSAIVDAFNKNNELSFLVPA